MTAEDPRRLAVRVHKAARRRGAARTLLLDLDGTLAPIVSRPEDASVPDEALEALRRLVERGWTVAVVSGRPAAEASKLVPVPGVRIFGSHGLEGTWGGGRRRPSLPDGVLQRMRRLADQAESLTQSTRGAFLERKPAGIAFHDRNVPSRLLPAWRRRLREWLHGQDLRGLETLRGRRVLEIRPRGVHKGMVARPVVDRIAPRRRDDSLVAVGDDRTDEDLFREIRSRGLAVRVGRSGVRTHATARLPSPRAVREFLARLAELESEDRGSGGAPR